MKWLFKHLQNLSKRRSKRFWGKDKALVSFAIPHAPDVVTLGQVIDINERGLSFRYIAQDVRTEGLKELKLFGYGDSDASLEKMPVRIIYDIEVKKKYFLSLPSMRRCGAEFGELSARQLSQLKNFIKKYAVL
ncbi:hypothetical protein [Desulforhabdus amnigena]|uniref:PilZ domain-containing protein n=1 Tax=Desulforhabdus amnigena TaxID=40218 RepID=A0A9W6FX51_9BACT|nr:hypothetical protein [Desulforhabdus amnigena]GLI36428.1 hypothetical protein DAMNIGENAA_38610 [Desulforhabdus amnigena]